MVLDIFRRQAFAKGHILCATKMQWWHYGMSWILLARKTSLIILNSTLNAQEQTNILDEYLLPFREENYPNEVTFLGKKFTLILRNIC